MGVFCHRQRRRRGFRVRRRCTQEHEWRSAGVAGNVRKREGLGVGLGGRARWIVYTRSFCQLCWLFEGFQSESQGKPAGHLQADGRTCAELCWSTTVSGCSPPYAEEAEHVRHTENRRPCDTGVPATRLYLVLAFPHGRFYVRFALHKRCKLYKILQSSPYTPPQLAPLRPPPRHPVTKAACVAAEDSALWSDVAGWGHRPQRLLHGSHKVLASLVSIWAIGVTIQPRRVGARIPQRHLQVLMRHAGRRCAVKATGI